MRREWKSIAELTGLTAVVASLVFVSFEIRQNTSQLRTDGARAVTEMVNQLNAAPGREALQSLLRGATQ